MNTKHAIYETNLEAIRADMARRETRLTTLIVVVSLATTILCFAPSNNRTPQIYLITPPTIETPTQSTP